MSCAVSDKLKEIAASLKDGNYPEIAVVIDTAALHIDMLNKEIADLRAELVRLKRK